MGIVFFFFKLHHSIIPSVFRSQRVFCCAGLFQVMFPHTNILTGGCLRASTLLLQTECLYYCCDRNRKDNLAGSWRTEELLWKRPSWALLRSRKRTLPVERTGTDFWFQAERSLSTPSKKSTPLKWWQLFPAVLRPTLSTLLKHLHPRPIQPIGLFVVFSC